jgi:hypothetical protein
VSRVDLVRGDAPDAILPRRFSHQATLAGVRRRSTHARSLGFRLIRVDRLVRESERGVRIPVMRRAMLGRVHLVQRWDQLRIVSAVGIHRRSVVKIRTTSGDGAAERFVEICYLAANIPVLDRVMKVSAVPARSRLMRVVTVAKCRPKCSAVPEMRSWTVSCYITAMWRSGRGASTAGILAVGRSIAVCTSVKRAVILKTLRRHIARDRQTWSPTAPVGRRPWLISRATLPGKPVTTRFRTV